MAITKKYVIILKSKFFRDGDIYHCSMGRYTTRAFSGNSITFGKSMNGVSNPLIFSMSTWNVSMCAIENNQNIVVYAITLD